MYCGIYAAYTDYNDWQKLCHRHRHHYRHNHQQQQLLQLRDKLHLILSKTLWLCVVTGVSIVYLIDVNVHVGQHLFSFRSNETHMHAFWLSIV